MAASNSTGATLGIRQGCDIVAHAIPFSFSDSTAFKALTIPASASKPVVVELQFLTALAFNGTTPSVGVGTTTAANELVASVAITAIANKSQAFTQVLSMLVADTDMYLKFTGGGSNTAGNGYVIVKIYTVNTTAV